MVFWYAATPRVERGLGFTAARHSQAWVVLEARAMEFDPGTLLCWHRDTRASKGELEGQVRLHADALGLEVEHVKISWLPDLGPPPTRN
jgi:hypothetical protein